MTPNHAISVVIPTYNRGDAIGPTLDWVLQQSLAPLEVIVVDDGSTDGTADWIEEKYAGHVTVIRQKNRGVAQARNRGWRVARGDWIAFLDHDDIWHQSKLEKLLAAATPDSGVIIPRWQEVDGSGMVLSQSPEYPLALLDSSRAFGWLFGWSSPLVSMSVPLVRRDLLKKVGGFDPHCAPADDWDVWLRLARQTKFAFVNEVLVDYTLHEGQQRRDERRMFRAVRRVLGKYPLELIKRPLLLWWLVWSGAFVPSIESYKAAKAGEDIDWRAIWKAHPLALLSPQWMALAAKRLLRRS